MPETGKGYLQSPNQESARDHCQCQVAKLQPGALGSFSSDRFPIKPNLPERKREWELQMGKVKIMKCLNEMNNERKKD